MKKLVALLILCSIPLAACGPDCEPDETEEWIPCGDEEPPICGHYECVPKEPSKPKDATGNGA